jgi:hypothetical protein
MNYRPTIAHSLIFALHPPLPPLARVRVSALPHFDRHTVTSRTLKQLHYPIASVLVHGVGALFYTANPKWGGGSASNRLVEIMQRAFISIEHLRQTKMPPILYLQMSYSVDTRCKEVFAYLSWLVRRRVFTEIQLSFAHQGHHFITHDSQTIDNLFAHAGCHLSKNRSCNDLFCVIGAHMRKSSALCRDELYSALRESFSTMNWPMGVVCEHMESIAAWGAWITLKRSNGRSYLNDMFIASASMHFRFWSTTIQARNRSSDQWSDDPSSSSSSSSSSFRLLSHDMPMSFDRRGVCGGIPPPSVPLSITAESIREVQHSITRSLDDFRVTASSAKQMNADAIDAADETEVPFSWSPYDRFRCEGGGSHVKERQLPIGKARYPSFHSMQMRDTDAFVVVRPHHARQGDTRRFWIGIILSASDEEITLQWYQPEHMQSAAECASPVYDYAEDEGEESKSNGDASSSSLSSSSSSSSMDRTEKELNGAWKAEVREVQDGRIEANSSVIERRTVLIHFKTLSIDSTLPLKVREQIKEALANDVMNVRVKREAAVERTKIQGMVKAKTEEVNEKAAQSAAERAKKRKALHSED